MMIIFLFFIWDEVHDHSIFVSLLKLLVHNISSITSWLLSRFRSDWRKTLGDLLSIYNLFIKTINFTIYFLYDESILRNYSLWRSFLNYYKSNFQLQKKTIYTFTRVKNSKFFNNLLISAYAHNFLISLIPWKERFVCIFHHPNQYS